MSCQWIRLDKSHKGNYRDEEGNAIVCASWAKKIGWESDSMRVCVTSLDEGCGGHTASLSYLGNVCESELCWGHSKAHETCYEHACEIVIGDGPALFIEDIFARFAEILREHRALEVLLHWEPLSQ